MQKPELIRAVAENAGLTQKAAEAAINGLIAVVGEELSSGEKVQLHGLGTFSVSQRQEREGINPRTGEKITIAASKSVSFKSAKALKDQVNS